ncbi:MAG: hypothetical protein ACTSRA_09855, partial [Promethearchaeota archaeon]
SGNVDGLAARGITSSIHPRRGGGLKVPRKRRHQRRCIEWIFGICVQCFDLENVHVRGLESVTKDLQLKFISLLFLSLIFLENGDDSLYLRPTYFFG